MSKKREASPGWMYPQTTIAEVPEGCAFAQKRHQTTHGGLACSLHPTEGDFLPVSHPEMSGLQGLCIHMLLNHPCLHAARGVSHLHDSYIPIQTATQLHGVHAGHQPQDELTRQSAQTSKSPFRQFDVMPSAYCNTFQQDQLNLKHAVNSWLKPDHTDTQTDCPQASHTPHGTAGTGPLPSPPFSAEPAAFGKGWAPVQAPTLGCVSTVHQFQGSPGGPAGFQQGSTNKTHAGCTNTSQVRGSHFVFLPVPPFPTPHLSPTSTCTCIHQYTYYTIRRIYCEQLFIRQA